MPDFLSAVDFLEELQLPFDIRVLLEKWAVAVLRCAVLDGHAKPRQNVFEAFLQEDNQVGVIAEGLVRLTMGHELRSSSPVGNEAPLSIHVSSPQEHWPTRR